MFSQRPTGFTLCFSHVNAIFQLLIFSQVSLRRICLRAKARNLVFINRQYSYSSAVLGRVGLDHECEAHAGNFLPNKYEKTAAEFAEFKENF